MVIIFGNYFKYDEDYIEAFDVVLYGVVTNHY